MNFKNKQAIFALTILVLTTSAQAFRFVVCGDCRAGNDDLSKPFPLNIFNAPAVDYVTSQIVALSPRPAFVIFLGDAVTKAQPPADPSITSNLAYWKSYMKRALHGIRLYTMVGNTDLNGPDLLPARENQTAFAETFSDMPCNGPTTPVDLRRLVYSFEYGKGTEKSLFAVIDTFAFYSAAGHDTIFANNNVDPAPYPTEQIDWLAAQAANSDANHKFVFTHGPAFAVTNGLAVGSNMAQIWNIALKNNFDTYFGAHQHLYYRWNVGISAYPPASRTLIQNIAGTIGAPPVPSTYVPANIGNRIYLGYNFVVVDVNGSTVTERAYIVYQKTTGGFGKKLFDTSIIVK